MEAPITVSYRWTVAEMLRAQRVAARNWWLGRALYFFFPLFGFIMLGSAAYTHLIRYPNAFNFISSAAVSLFLISLPFLTRRRLRKSLERRPDRDMMVNFEITDEHVSNKTPLSSTEMKWDSIIKVLRLRDAFLLYHSERQFFWLPLDAFAQPEDVERFATLARSKVQTYREKL